MTPTTPVIGNDTAGTPLHRSQKRESVRFLVFSASLRTGSLNTRLAQLAAMPVAFMSDFGPMPTAETDGYTEVLGRLGREDSSAEGGGGHVWARGSGGDPFASKRLVSSDEFN